MLPTTLFQSIIALSLAAQSRAATVSVNLPIVNKNISPDGFTRQTVLAGGTYPGTLITGNMGDTFKINVENQLHDLSMFKSTSIHWHGLFQHTTADMDGAAFINQCPIAANHSFLYEFSTPNQAGTYWYHSHLATQYCDGLRGPLVIYDPHDPLKRYYDVDDESTVLTLGDWYHVIAQDQPVIPVPDAALLNGLGRYADGPQSELAVVSVKKGLRYRMRLVEISCDSNYIFSIDGHEMTIIEADGVSTEPLIVDSLQIFASQRYSFVLNANQPVNNYWIRFVPDNGNTSFINNINMAILRYAGARDCDPTTIPTKSWNPLLETNLHPLTDCGAPGDPHPGGVDKAINMVMGFNYTSFGFTLNGETFDPPTVPVLLQILSGAKQASELMPSSAMYSLPRNSVIELSFPNDAAAPGFPHPFHLHGHSFSVVRSANSSEYNYKNPIRRDTVNTGSGGDNVTIRFTTDNPGPWFLHCHIDWHLKLGFAAVMAEDLPDVPTVDNPTAAWKELCPIYDSLSESQL